VARVDDYCLVVFGCATGSVDHANVSEGDDRIVNFDELRGVAAFARNGE